MMLGFKPYDFSFGTPESVGIPSRAITEYAARLKEGGYGVQGYIIYRKGKIVSRMIAQPYQFSDQRHVYSISKSWVGTAIGIARDEGLISLDDKVISFFPDKLPETVSDNLAAMTVHDLLSMSSGHESDSTDVCIQSSDWVRTYLAYEVKHKPGTYWCYDSANQYMLCAMIQRVTGQSCLDYLRPRLLDPLGITGVEWDTCPDGINAGGWGIHLSPEDMLKLGMTYLYLGEFNGQRIFSIDWARRASSYKTSNTGSADWSQGYCYTLWRCQHQCFRGDGAFGQLMVILPEQEAVWIQISDDNRFQAMMDIFWDTVYPAMQRTPGGESLPENKEALDELRSLETSFEASPLLPGGDAGMYSAAYSVKGCDVFDSISVTADGDNAEIRIGRKGPDEIQENWEFASGNGKWMRTRLVKFPTALYEMMQQQSTLRPSHIASCFRRSGNVFTFNAQFVDSPHGLRFTVDGDSMLMTVTRNIDPSHPINYKLSSAPQLIL